VISDDASGIPVDKLGLAVSPAAIQTSNSLSEHGLGMKQAVSALGKLNYLATKTSEESEARVIREFRFGNIPLYTTHLDRDSGTVISVVELKPIVVVHAATLTRTIIPYLGARYRWYLKPEDPQVQIRMQILPAGKPNEPPIYDWEVVQVKPVYFHPSTRDNRPVIERYPLAGDGWNAELTFGYAPHSDEEYEELGIPRPTKFHPYNVSLNRQGLDIILHGRVILFHQLSELGIISVKHNDYNDIRGEITLLSGFGTAITKNSIIRDRHFEECIQKVTEVLTGEAEGPGKRKENYLKRKTYPEEIPEKLLRDRLKEWLLNNPLQKHKVVQTEYVIEGIEGYIDILADGEAWEIKVDQASASDVYQLFMYMDVGGLDKGFLVAKDFSTGAQVAASHILNVHGKSIELAARQQFPINHPPSPSERDEYY